MLTGADNVITFFQVLIALGSVAPAARPRCRRPRPRRHAAPRRLARRESIPAYYLRGHALRPLRDARLDSETSRQPVVCRAPPQVVRRNAGIVVASSMTTSSVPTISAKSRTSSVPAWAESTASGTRSQPDEASRPSVPTYSDPVTTVSQAPGRAGSSPRPGSSWASRSGRRRSGPSCGSSGASPARSPWVSRPRP